MARGARDTRSRRCRRRRSTRRSRGSGRFVEYELIGRNPASISTRKLKTSRARRTYLDDAELIAALLDAAGELDQGARGPLAHRSTHAARDLAFSGPRIGELLDCAGATWTSPAVATRAPTRSCSRRAPAAAATTTICARGCSEGDRAANEHRAAADLTPLPEGLTFHSLRHTHVSALFALGYELTVMMAEVGHADPKVTLGTYAHSCAAGRS